MSSNNTVPGSESSIENPSHLRIHRPLENGETANPVVELMAGIRERATANPENTEHLEVALQIELELMRVRRNMMILEGMNAEDALDLDMVRIGSGASSRVEHALDQLEMYVPETSPDWEFLVTHREIHKQLDFVFARKSRI